jgi:two-component system, OmpR family, sensor histidine kinase TctE
MASVESPGSADASTFGGALATYRIKRRLLVLIFIPLAILATLSAAFDYRQAGSANQAQDQQLMRLVPLLADSVIAPGRTDAAPPLVLLAPALAEFLRDREGRADYRLSNYNGAYLDGAAWLPSFVPNTAEGELHSTLYNGVTYRIASQRLATPAGDLVVSLADGSGAQQQWLRSLLFKVLVPNMVLGLAAFFAVGWAVDRALQPLMELRRAVQNRSPQDLQPLAPYAVPYEVKPLVESINLLMSQADAQAQSQKRFVADAAHQLRTPLAALQSQVEAWALQSRGSENLRIDPADMQRMLNATRRTSLLARQLLTLSRADAQSANAQPMQLLALHTLAEDAMTDALDAATAKGIDLGLEASPAHAMGHDWLLRELLANLIDNAIKYAPRGAQVTVRCAAESKATVLLEVQDNGPGIAPAERVRVVERFYRSQGASGEGNGLGLAIAAEIAAVHGSSLHIETPAKAQFEGRGVRIGLRLNAT